MDNTPSNANQNRNAQSPSNQEPQSGFSFSTFLYPIAIFLVINIAMNFIKGGGNNPNAINLTSIVSNITFYDVNFYLSKDQSVPRRAKPIYTLKDMKYSYSTDPDISLQDRYEINFTSTYNISHILNMRKKNKAAIYLITQMVFHNQEEQKYLQKKYAIPDSAFYQYINVLEYVDDLTSFFTGGDDMNSPPVEKPRQLENNTNAIPNLFYKPVLSLHFAKMPQKEEITKFQIFQQMRFPFYMNLDDMVYFPIISLDDFWCESSEYVPMNKTEITVFNFTLSHSYVNSYLFTMMLNINIQMNQSMIYKTAKDVLIQLLKYNTVTYLVILFTVQILHMLFSSLDFLTNISYYNNLKKLDGVYTKYIFFNLFYILFAFLYVIIKGSDFITKVMLFKDLAFQIWKLRKIFTVSFSKTFPFISFGNKIEYVAEKSKDYENEAISFMVKFLLIPVGIFYFIYRAYYFYSSDTSLINFIIEYVFFLFGVFGFILMTPQVYLNYKLQSVDHFPFKIMIFKFLDTIVDDLEIFALKSPTLYRIFCFKDDVIFVIYLYQLFKYKDNRLIDQVKKNELEEQKKKELQEKKDN